MITLAVFDIAGTTVDERDEVYRTLRAAVEREGATVSPAELQKWMGTEKRWAIRNLMQAGGLEPTDAVVDSAYAWFLDSLRDSYRTNPPQPLPGVPEAMAVLRARGIKVALTTGFSTEIAAPLLAGLGWTAHDGDPSATLDAVVCADMVAAGRPAPHMIHRAMEATGIQDVAQVAAAGDTAADVLAARRAGVLSIGVLTGHMSREDFAPHPHDAIVDSVVDLLSDARFAGTSVTR
ncbi:phosphonatase-like hydrolase [Arthrobacter sp. MA-N2]|uniref:phosphonatase-like hydrolase n=1 Tax=Arthrobacter sp. MA-N2 TaxID=1101188 RepID=UPI000481BCC8|nr:phosphonatase-like hydrolase [Arthrobacter sp. MA-N2]